MAAKPPDFKSSGVRAERIIASGSSQNPTLLIIGSGAAGNNGVSVNTNQLILAGTGSDTWLFISGSTDGANFVTFGGDVFISGTLFGGGGGGTPGGSTTQVQFNDGGSFGGDSALTWKNIPNTLTLSGTLLTTGSAQFGGGYGTSGVTIGDNGDILTNGSLTVDGVTVLSNTTTITGSLLTTGIALFAGGYGNSGVTITAAGNISTDGSLTVDGHSTLGNSSLDTVAFNAFVTSSIVPTHNVTWDLGSPSLRWANVYTGDLHLQNDRGDWTIIEEHDFLRVVNNKTGRSYKMMMEPID